MNPFSEYAQYYDLFYDEKDYVGECDYLGRHIRKLKPGSRRLLELGVGTGRHALSFFQSGFSVEGVDISPAMLAIARENCREAEEIRLHLGDVRDVRVDTLFDVVLSLFHVASYQPTLEDLAALFTTARCHLKVGGVFMFDFWYAPAVLYLKSEARSRTIEHGDLKITREALPSHLPKKRCVDVQYWFRITRPGSPAYSFKEVHKMRYFDLQEIDQELSKTGFERIFAEEWLTGVPLSEMTWSACIAARAV